MSIAQQFIKKLKVSTLMFIYFPGKLEKITAKVISIIFKNNASSPTVATSNRQNCLEITRRDFSENICVNNFSLATSKKFSLQRSLGSCLIGFCAKQKLSSEMMGNSLHVQELSVSGSKNFHLL
jgi:hypothetical protein